VENWSALRSAEPSRFSSSASSGPGWVASAVRQRAISGSADWAYADSARASAGGSSRPHSRRNRSAFSRTAAAASYDATSADSTSVTRGRTARPELSNRDATSAFTFRQSLLRNPNSEPSLPWATTSADRASASGSGSRQPVAACRAACSDATSDSCRDTSSRSACAAGEPGSSTDERPRSASGPTARPRPASSCSRATLSLCRSTAHGWCPASASTAAPTSSQAPRVTAARDGISASAAGDAHSPGATALSGLPANVTVPAGSAAATASTASRPRHHSAGTGSNRRCSAARSLPQACERSSTSRLTTSRNSGAAADVPALPPDASLGSTVSPSAVSNAVTVLSSASTRATAAVRRTVKDSRSLPAVSHDS
jgi:hypothetical protein